MTPTIETVVDRQRGCGWRKPGGLYLRCDTAPTPCKKLPVPFFVCPKCGRGLEQCRGWMTIDPADWIESGPCSFDGCTAGCPFNEPPLAAGLLWIGLRFYPTPAAFLKEWAEQGISKRIPRVPRSLVLGKTVVYLVHPRRAASQDVEDVRVIIGSFVPDRIEYVVKGDETAAALEKLVELGIRPVRIERAGEAGPLFA
jgi:hypothetical protein